MNGVNEKLKFYSTLDVLKLYGYPADTFNKDPWDKENDVWRKNISVLRKKSNNFNFLKKYICK